MKTHFMEATKGHCPTFLSVPLDREMCIPHECMICFLVVFMCLYVYLELVNFRYCFTSDIEAFRLII